MVNANPDELGSCLNNYKVSNVTVNQATGVEKNLDEREDKKKCILCVERIIRL